MIAKFFQCLEQDGVRDVEKRRGTLKKCEEEE